MAINWQDTPGSVLPNRREGINFTAERVVDDIRAVYSEERVWDGAAQEFLEPFLGSTKVGNAYELKRTGGWNRPFTVYVDEQPPDSLWNLLYDIDFAAQPTQAIASTSGSAVQTTAVIDGKTWSFRLSDTNSPISIALTNGVGLVLNARSAVSWEASALVGSCVHLDYATQLPGYSASKQTATLARATWPRSTTNGDGFGVSSFDFLTAATHISGGIRSLSGTVALVNPSSSTPPLQVNAEPIPVSPATLDRAIAVIRQSATKGWCAQLPWEGSMPTIEALEPFCSGSNTAKTAASGGGVYACSGNFATTQVVTVKRMQVWQKAA